MNNRLEKYVFFVAIYDSDVGNIVNTDSFSTLSNCVDDIKSILFSFEPDDEVDSKEVWNQYRAMDVDNLEHEAYGDLDSKGFWSYWLPGQHRLIYASRHKLDVDIKVSVEMETK